MPIKVASVCMYGKHRDCNFFMALLAKSYTFYTCDDGNIMWRVRGCDESRLYQEITWREYNMHTMNGTPLNGHSCLQKTFWFPVYWLAFLLFFSFEVENWRTSTRGNPYRLLENMQNSTGSNPSSGLSQELWMWDVRCGNATCREEICKKITS